MRFDYAIIGGPLQSERVVHVKCGKPMLGIGEQDPRSWSASTVFDKSFCDCPEDAMTNQPSQSVEDCYVGYNGEILTQEFLEDKCWKHGLMDEIIKEKSRGQLLLCIFNQAECIDDWVQRFYDLKRKTKGLVEALEHYESAHYCNRGFPCDHDEAATEALKQFKK